MPKQDRGDVVPCRADGRKLLRALFLTLLLAAASNAQERVRFVGVTLDPETAKADAALCEALSKSLGAAFTPSVTPVSYGDAIDAVAGRSPDACPEYVARLTPYACVVAEMRGAEFTILGTYESKTNQSRTYRSNFVVKKHRFLTADKPTLGDLVEHMRGFRKRAESRKAGDPKESPLLFIYHDQYSTSSFFLPSLVFRESGLFTGSDGSMAAFKAEKRGEKSSELIELVANGDADLAAVWDGARSSWEAKHGANGAVAFIQIDVDIPNDLLVCAKCMRNKDAIRRAAVTPEIDIGDFKKWVVWDAAPDARAGYAALRQRAADRPASVSVQVEAKRNVDEEWFEAAKQAIRLSGTELTVRDEDSDSLHYDAKWELEMIHDGAIKLTTSIKEADLEPQTFVISFSGREDLARRIAGLIHSGMHRFRYLWPYERTKPTILRDINFPVMPGDHAVVQRLKWNEATKRRMVDKQYSATIASSDYHAIELAPFSDEGTLDPMSEVSYRVILERPSTEDPVVRWFTIGLVALSALGIAAAYYDIRRGRKSTGAGTSPGTAALRARAGGVG